MTEEATEPKFVALTSDQYREYRDCGLLWATNQLINWPLGMALAVIVGREGPRLAEAPKTLTEIELLEIASSKAAKEHTVARLLAHIEAARLAPGAYEDHLVLMQWEWPDGHRETIENEYTAKDIRKEPGHQHPLDRLRTWVNGRLSLMPEPDRNAAHARLSRWIYWGELTRARWIEKPEQVSKSE